MSKKILILTVVVGLGALILRSCCNCNQKIPDFDLNERWGPEQKGSVDDSVRPFTITFSKEMVEDLKSRLSRRQKWTPPLEGISFEYGFNSVYLEQVLDYWQNKYDFKKREQFLNQYPQFKTNIQGLDIHFIRVTPKAPGVKVLPLLMIHGWPGSVREFYEIIPLLTTPRAGQDFVFELILPSIPGYGFSQAATRPGLATPHIAVIMRNLMNRLGFKEYYVQGGDWGSIIVSHMTLLFPNEILGHHSNAAGGLTKTGQAKMFLGAYLPSLVVDKEMESWMYPLSKTFSFIIEETGYLHLQATKPDTIGVALSDSPSGLAAYILEKFTTWTNRNWKSKQDGGLTTKFTLDQLLDNLMIYWSSGSITTSMRLYAENFSSKSFGLGMEGIPSVVPTWALQSKHELMYQPPSILRTKYPNLVDVTVVQDGGHFLAFELPKVVSDDVYKAVNAFIKWRKDQSKKEL